ncbi:type II secretion system F family protein [Patescibacteria group bacterium]|nr:type II secretion system F family protein [Patescibacteria group bacterium]MBU2220021.1 type II secretion system F family protein [Patescibacteria group bacterium]MBU2265105.1 type II secretion system F family protein [Patescibacteria group bacterium]
MNFNYVARTKEGEMQTGIVEAATRNGAIETLQSRGLILLDLQSAASGSIFSANLKIFQRVRMKDLANFARQLATLVSAQVPLLSSLQSLSNQTENEYFQEIIFETANDVEGGMVFSRALAKHPKVFSDFFVNMVRSGEVSGGLENSLNYLADYLEKQYYLNAKIKGALTYPAFIFGTFILIAALMMILIVPKLTDFLKDSGQSLPFLTRVIIGVSEFLTNWWWVVLAILVGGGYYLASLIKNSAGARQQWDTMKINLPVFGKRVFQKIYITRIADNLSTLIQGGLSILQALQVTSEVVGNTVYQKIVEEAKEEVRVGGALSSSFAKHKEIPAMVTQMIITGEQTGSLDIILKKLGQFYNKEVDNTVATISQLIEPMLILLIGGGVAILVAAILMPIYSIANSM